MIRNTVHGTTIVITAALLAFTGTPDARASSGGAKPPGFTGSPASFGQTCMACHADPPGSGMVELLNAPVTYRQDLIYDLIVHMSDPDQVGAGFEISTEDPDGSHLGTLVVSDPVNTQLVFDDWLTHTGDGVADSIANWAAMGQSAEYTLRWQAPAADAGPVTFWVAGNAINDGQGSNGDFVYTTNGTAAYCPADTNNDGAVNVNDLVAVIKEWGCTTPCTADVNNDGVVDVNDLVDVISAWGGC